MFKYQIVAGYSFLYMKICWFSVCYLIFYWLHFGLVLLFELKMQNYDFSNILETKRLFKKSDWQISLIDDKNDQQFPSLSQRYDNLTSL